jgi:hypothetical protein
MNFIKSFPGARFGFWAGAPRIVNEEQPAKWDGFMTPKWRLRVSRLNLGADFAQIAGNFRRRIASDIAEVQPG